jgi:hypothetical protein
MGLGFSSLGLPERIFLGTEIVRGQRKLGAELVPNWCRISAELNCDTQARTPPPASGERREREACVEMRTLPMRAELAPSLPRSPAQLPARRNMCVEVGPLAPAPESCKLECAWFYSDPWEKVLTWVRSRGRNREA